MAGSHAPQTNDDPVYLTRQQAADRCQVTAQTIDNWRFRYGLPTVGAGRTVRIRADVLDDWLEKQGR